jgi:clan AA aspartic protease (TIGR02281 family)
MVLCRIRWALGFAAVAALLAGPLRAADKAPEELLKGRGLKRVGSTFVLTSAEAAAQRKLNELKLLSGQLNIALQQQEALELGTESQKAMIRELSAEYTLLGEQIQVLDQQLAAMTTTVGGQNYTNTLGAQMNAQRNQAVLTYNNLGNRIRLLQTQASDPALQKEIRAEVPRRREAYTQGVLDLRQVVDTTAKEYDELAKNDEVKRALDALGRTSNVKLKLGPSREFLAIVKVLERVEKSVVTDEVELVKEGGIYWVNATFNGKVTERLAFDTGAAYTTISSELAARIGLKPQPSDRAIELQVADGSVVQAKQMTIPSIRVGKFTVNGVVCAVLPPGKREIPLLLGQSFHRHFTYKFTPESGRLAMSKVETLEQPQGKSTRPARNAGRGKRSTKSKGTTGKAGPADGP